LKETKLRGTRKNIPASEAPPAKTAVAGFAQKDSISIDEAVTALRRSGYLLETRIARQLDEFADHLALNVVFADPESNQARELDAYCFKAENSESQEFFESSAHLLIECINNPQPIAFFCSAGNGSAYPIVASRPAWVGPNLIEESIKIEHFHHHLRGPYATNYCTFVLKKKGEWMVTHADEQHQEFTTLAKLAQLTREKALKILEDHSRPMDAIQMCGIEYICPILVVEGTLFDVSENPGREIKIREVDHVRYVKTHIWRNARRYCPIDVVTESFFPKLLRKITCECKRTLSRMERRADDILQAARDNTPKSDNVREDFLP
jgi:hypothetical protein